MFLKVLSDNLSKNKLHIIWFPKNTEVCALYEKYAYVLQKLILSHCHGVPMVLQGKLPNTSGIGEHGE